MTLGAINRWLRKIGLLLVLAIPTEEDSPPISLHLWTVRKFNREVAKAKAEKMQAWKRSEQKESVLN